MRFTIGAKLLVSFLGLLVVVLAVGWYTLLVNQRALEEAVGQGSVFLAEDTIRRIDKDIFLKIEQLEQFADDPLVHAVLAEPTDEGRAALQERMREVFISFSELRYGYREYSGVSVVDSQGNYIAQTDDAVGLTAMDSARMQSVRDDGSAAGVFTYDDRLGVWGIPLSVRITNQQGEFVGVITGVVSAGILVRVEELQGKRYDTTNVILLTGEGEKIYETGAFQFLEDTSREDYYQMIGEASGFFVAEETDREKLYSYAHSAGFRSYDGLGWVLLISHDTEEVFTSVRTLRNVLVAITGGLLIIIVGLAIVLSRSIANPIKVLTSQVERIAQGDLETAVSVKSSDEVGILAGAFNDMTGKLRSSYAKLEQQITELKELDRLKDNFLNNTTHELKTPLIPIKSQVQLLLAEDYGSLNAEQKKSIAMIARNEDQLESIVTDVVNITKIRSGKLKLVKAPADLTNLITMAVQDFQELARSEGIQLRLQFGAEFPELTLDAKRITQVVSNLLNNALKFTPKGGEVTVTATIKQGKAVVSISDTGIGMSKETLKKLFTPFWQAESDAARKYEGTGLGLAISKGFVEAHGGTIEAESAGEGKGTILTFTLPWT